MSQSSKSVIYDNYIYYTICETTLMLSKSTNYSSHFTFCHNFNNSLMLNNLDKKERKQLDAIVNELVLIYNLSIEKAAEYIYDYFSLQKYKIFEFSVRYTTKALKGLSD